MRTLTHPGPRQLPGLSQALVMRSQWRWGPRGPGSAPVMGPSGGERREPQRPDLWRWGPKNKLLIGGRCWVGADWMCSRQMTWFSPLPFEFDSSSHSYPLFPGIQTQQAQMQQPPRLLPRFSLSSSFIYFVISKRWTWWNTATKWCGVRVVSGSGQVRRRYGDSDRKDNGGGQPCYSPSPLDPSLDPNEWKSA